MKIVKRLPTEETVVQFEGTLESVMELIEAFPYTREFLRRCYKYEYAADEIDEEEWICGIMYSPIGDDLYEVSIPTSNGLVYANAGDWVFKDEQGVKFVMNNELFEIYYK